MSARVIQMAPRLADARSGAILLDGPPAAAVSLPSPAQRDVDQAELFLLSLEGEMLADGPRTAYLLGLAEGHLANLIEIVRGRQ